MEDKIIELPTELMQSITPEQAWHYLIIPKTYDKEQLEFFHSDENNSVSTKEELEVLFGKKVILQDIPSDILKKNLSKYYLKNKTASNEHINRINGNTKVDENNQFKTNDFLFNLIDEANNLLCSDIHIEAYEGGARIRFRIDGKLFERYVIKKEDYPTLINKVKILSNLDIAEKRLPQDGRILYKSVNKSFDIRVSIIPSIYGEKIVLRLLRKSASDINILNLGFSKLQLDSYLNGTKKPYGIILISGPTGSGKSTTLYATLNVLNKKDINILTIEDPIEYTIEGINQVQLREDIGLSFTRALRSFLRQDPDIIMLGEVRDSETAQMAIRAALTGHLVFSTIHTNTAWGIITRLIDMGIPPFLLSSTIITAVSQRLVRKLCTYCKEEQEFNTNLLPPKFKAIKCLKSHFLPVGCEHCNNSGYSGRVAAFEVLSIDKELKESIRQSQLNIDELFKQKNIQTLTSNAFELFINGITSLEEIIPILLSDI